MTKFLFAWTEPDLKCTAVGSLSSHMWVVVPVFFPVQVKLTSISTLTFQACGYLKLELDCMS